jgi:DNA-binding NarL/FixJ family response regulator
MDAVIDVIIVEDNLKFQDVLKLVVNSDEGLNCVQAFDSTEKLHAYLEKNKNKVDLILLDIELPGKNGIESIKGIKDALPETKIVMLSQLDNDINIFNALSYGANGYLLKSSSMAEIKTAIKNAHQGIPAMSPYIASRVIDMFKHMTQPKKEYELTDQEKKVLNEVVEGLSKKQIAEKLFISHHTVDFHIRNIYQKLNVHTQVDLVTKTIREQLI